MLSLEEIKKRIPHRFPFLLIDRVLELEEGKSCKALKNVTGNELFFEGHFPGHPIMPGVLILEALAQTCAITGFALEENPDSKLLLFIGIDKARFKKQVVPGDQLILITEVSSRKFNFWVFQGKAYVDDILVAQAEIRVATVDKDQQKS